jgi:hypothetical protein
MKNRSVYKTPGGRSLCVITKFEESGPWSEPALPDQGPVRARQLAERAICCTNPTLTIH